MVGNNIQDQEENNHAKLLILVTVECELKHSCIRCTTDDHILIARFEAIDWMFNSPKEDRVDLLPYLDEDYLFRRGDIRKMGKFVFVVLEYNIPVVNPFDYISPLATLFVQ
ncbi:hypothetical protein Tco_0921410 [Tanacetum coccineum]